MSMTETRQQVVTEANGIAERPLMERMNTASILKASMRVNPQSIAALRSVWSELSDELVTARAGDLRRNQQVVRHRRSS